jgi:hypothetical protein
MKKAKCEACEFRGYSTEVCRLHSTHDGSCKEPDDTSKHPLKTITKAVAVGAGAGVAVTIAGIAVGPIIGLNAVLGHAIAAKIIAGSGVVGAGASVARKLKKGSSKAKAPKKRVLLPMYLKG